MHELDRRWMAYIDKEVRATCDQRGWGYQLRRKWSVRDKAVSLSPVEDYEWKLIPDANDRLQDQPPSDFDEGTYYVLSVDRGSGRFVLQHDTNHCGIYGPHWHQSSYTEIHFGSYLELYDLAEDFRQPQGTEHGQRLDSPPADGWLRNHLIDLTARFKPNHFCNT